MISIFCVGFQPADWLCAWSESVLPNASMPRANSGAVAYFISPSGWCDIIDHMKLPDHVGLMWRYPLELIRSKKQLYAKAGIDTLSGDIPFQVAAIPAVTARL